jgi:hypothetical protein
VQVIGRRAELAELGTAWERAGEGQPQLVVVWGRRRVGKTYLLTHFADGKRAVYFTATRQDSEERQLSRFADRVREQLGEEVRDLVPAGFPDWEAGLRFIVRLARAAPLLLVIDEAPRLATARADFADLLSAVWENVVRDHRLMLVLTGSAVSVMEEMLGPHGGLHRRPTVERRMDPFSLSEARPFQPDLPAEAFIEAYAACGGYPLHLRRWRADRSTPDNLRELAFTPAGLLVRDATDILSEDLDWRGGYERVLTAMAGGARRRSRIAGRAQQRIDYTLDRLRRAGYVRVVRSIGAGGSPDPMYEIGDTYLAFWFAVLRDDADLIEGGQGEAVRHRTDGRWRQHLAAVFETAAREHAVQMVAAGELPPDTVVGRWWRDEVAEIDVLALSGGRPVLIGECRWQAQDMTERDLAELRRKAGLVPAADLSGMSYAFWSRGGATQALARHPDVRTFTPADLLGGLPPAPGSG